MIFQRKETRQISNNDAQENDVLPIHDAIQQPYKVGLYATGNSKAKWDISQEFIKAQQKRLLLHYYFLEKR